MDKVWKMKDKRKEEQQIVTALCLGGMIIIILATIAENLLWL